MATFMHPTIERLMVFADAESQGNRFMLGSVFSQNGYIWATDGHVAARAIDHGFGIETTPRTPNMEKALPKEWFSLELTNELPDIECLCKSCEGKGYKETNKCLACNGNKVCCDCRGYGKTACVTCGQDETCDECNGDGDCRNCGGTGVSSLTTEECEACKDNTVSIDGRYFRTKTYRKIKSLGDVKYSLLCDLGYYFIVFESCEVRGIAVEVKQN